MAGQQTRRQTRRRTRRRRRRISPRRVGTKLTGQQTRRLMRLRLPVGDGHGCHTARGQVMTRHCDAAAVTTADAVTVVHERRRQMSQRAWASHDAVAKASARTWSGDGGRCLTASGQVTESGKGGHGGREVSGSVRASGVVVTLIRITATIRRRPVSLARTSRATRSTRSESRPGVPRARRQASGVDVTDITHARLPTSIRPPTGAKDSTTVGRDSRGAWRERVPLSSRARVTVETYSGSVLTAITSSMVQATLALADSVTRGVATTRRPDQCTEWG
jgi:hypothetical protein